MQSIQTAQSLPADYTTAASATPAGKPRRPLLKLVLVLTGVCAGLGICELTIRALQLGHTRAVVLYNDKIFKLPPHASFMNYDENKNFVTTNNLGFHDRERETASGNYRILFLGDSFVEGRQVDVESLFTVRLEKKFAGNGQKIETINGGVPSTGTAYQYALWKEFFEPSIKVDRVVLCFFMGNDVTDNNLDLRLSTFGETDNNFFLDGQGNVFDTRKRLSRFKRTINYFRDHSVLMDSLYEGAYRKKLTLQADSGGVNGGDEGARVERSGAWQASEQGTFALIERWKAELAAKNVAFDLVVIDRPGKVYNKFELQFLAKLQTACAQDQIDCLRLKLTEDPYEAYSFDGISLGHFNNKGHELAANELYDFLQAQDPARFGRTSAQTAASGH